MWRNKKPLNIQYMWEKKVKCTPRSNSLCVTDTCASGMVQHACVSLQREQCGTEEEGALLCTDSKHIYSKYSVIQ